MYILILDALINILDTLDSLRDYYILYLYIHTGHNNK